MKNRLKSAPFLKSAAAADITKLSNEALLDKYISRPLFLYLAEKLHLEQDLPAAHAIVAEAVKLLLLIPYSKGNAPISRELDEVWHLLILETKEYQKLCEKLPGAQFIHHKSIVFEKYENLQNGTTDKKDFKEDLKQKLSWFVSYKANFGDFTEAAIKHWPIGLEIMKDKKIDLSEFNALLGRAAQPRD